MHRMVLNTPHTECEAKWNLTFQQYGVHYLQYLKNVVAPWLISTSLCAVGSLACLQDKVWMTEHLKYALGALASPSKLEQHLRCLFYYT